MRLSKAKLREIKSALFNNSASDVPKMTDAELLKRAGELASFRYEQPVNRDELIQWVLKWSIHDIIPDHMV